MPRTWQHPAVFPRPQRIPAPKSGAADRREVTCITAVLIIIALVFGAQIFRSVFL